MDKFPLHGSDPECNPARGRITYAPDVDAQIEARVARVNSRRSRSCSRDSMSIRESRIYMLVQAHEFSPNDENRLGAKKR